MRKKETAKNSNYENKWFSNNLFLYKKNMGNIQFYFKES